MRDSARPRTRRSTPVRSVIPTGGAAIRLPPIGADKLHVPAHLVEALLSPRPRRRRPTRRSRWRDSTEIPRSAICLRRSSSDFPRPCGASSSRIQGSRALYPALPAMATTSAIGSFWPEIVLVLRPKRNGLSFGRLGLAPPLRRGQAEAQGRSRGEPVPPGEIRALTVILPRDGFGPGGGRLRSPDRSGWRAGGLSDTGGSGWPSRFRDLGRPVSPGDGSTPRCRANSHDPREGRPTP